MPVEWPPVIMNAGPSRLRRHAAVLLFAGLFSHGAWNSLPKAAALLKSAFAHRDDSLLESRRRVLGDYALAIEEVRKTLPPGEDFLLIGTSSTGANVFAHYDLAPRKSPYLGPGVAADPEKLRALGKPLGAPRYAVVIRDPDYLPRLVLTDEFFSFGAR